MTVISRAILRHQPKQPMPIDRGNPLTNGLVSLLDMANLTDAVYQRPSIKTGSGTTPLHQSRFIGRYVGSVSGAFTTPIDNDIGTADSTTFMLVEKRTSSDLEAGFSCGCYSAAGDHTSMTTKHLSLGRRWGVSLNGTLIDSGVELTVGGIYFLLHVQKGGTSKLYQDGVLKATSVTANGDSGNGRFTACNAGSPGINSSSLHGVFLAGRYNRALSETEIKELSLNPWQLFMPGSPKSFFLLAQNGGSTPPIIDGAALINYRRRRLRI